MLALQVTRTDHSITASLWEQQDSGAWCVIDTADFTYTRVPVATYFVGYYPELRSLMRTISDIQTFDSSEDLIAAVDKG